MDCTPGPDQDRRGPPVRTRASFAEIASNAAEYMMVSGGQAFKQTAYALDRDSRKAELARFFQSAAAGEHEGLPLAA